MPSARGRRLMEIEASVVITLYPVEKLGWSLGAQEHS